jgi:hypothetical protein
VILAAQQPPAPAPQVIAQILGSVCKWGLISQTN